MYYAAQALLAIKGLSSKTHKGIIQFGQHFIKTGEIAIAQGTALSDAYDFRRLSDYDEAAILTQQQAEVVLRSAKILF